MGGHETTHDGGGRAVSPSQAEPEPPVEPSAQPATEAAAGEDDAVRGKATRSPAEVATRRNLEGSEQGPA